MFVIPVGFRPEKGCDGDAYEKLKTISLTSLHNCLKIIKERWRKLVAGPRWVPVTMINYSTDRQS
jgi:hypothetical protein